MTSDFLSQMVAESLIIRAAGDQAISAHLARMATALVRVVNTRANLGDSCCCEPTLEAALIEGALEVAKLRSML